MPHMGRRSIALGLVLVLATSACSADAGDSARADPATTALAAPAATAADISDLEPSAPPSTDAAPTYHLSPIWTGGRTNADGTELRLLFHGGPPFSEDDPCSIDYAGTEIESSTEIEIEVTARRPELFERDPDVVCPDVSYERVLTVELAAPVGDRTVSGFTPPHRLFDGALLVDLDGIVPNGWDITRDAPPLGSGGTSHSWSRTWALPRPPNGANAPCIPTPSPITLIEGPAELTDAEPGFASGTTEQVQIDATHVGTLISDSSATDLRLAWNDGDRGYVLSSGMGCQGDTPTDSEHLIDIAWAIIRRTGPTYEALGADDWVGGRLDNDGRQLRMWVVGRGSDTLDPANPCSVQYMPTATETESEITVSVTARTAVPIRGGDCPDDWGLSVIVVDLVAPVGDRRVFALGTYREFVDPDDLVDLDDVIPPGWELVYDGPPSQWDVVESKTDWTRTWRKRGEGPRIGEPCDPAEWSDVSLTEGPSGLLDRYGEQFAATTESVQISPSTTGVLESDGVGTRYRLYWSADGRDFVLSTMKGCGMDDPFTNADHVIAFARAISS